jgi:hypothetical protein
MTWPDIDDADLSTVAGIVATVQALEYSSGQARSWTEGGTCHPGTSNRNPCQEPACIARAVRYSGEWAYEAAHHARRLAGLVASPDRHAADQATPHPIELRYVRYDGTPYDDLDEIVATNATVHLERMDGSTFMLTVHTANPVADLSLWIGPKRAKCQAGMVCAAGNVLQKRPAAVPTEPQPAARTEEG